jgi:hypothetical protein
MFKNFFFLLLASVLVAGLQREISAQTLTANAGPDDSTYQDPRVPVDEMIDQSLESGTITGDASDQSGSQVVAELRDASAEISVHMPKFDAAKVTQLQLLKLINWVKFLAEKFEINQIRFDSTRWRLQIGFRTFTNQRNLRKRATYGGNPAPRTNR